MYVVKDMVVDVTVAKHIIITGNIFINDNIMKSFCILSQIFFNNFIIRK
jgi:hypothetical protein